VQGNRKWFNNSKDTASLGEGWSGCFAPLLGHNGRRLRTLQEATRSKNSRLAGPKGPQHSTFKKQGESGLQFISAGRERTLRPFVFLRWTAAAIAKTAASVPRRDRDKKAGYNASQ